jgi:hypothetical protein
MTSATDQAVALKNDGNKAFAAHDWPKAIDLYTKAIELNDKEPTFYLNRAQVGTHHLPVLPMTSARVTYREMRRPTSSRKHMATLSQMRRRRSS